MFPLFNLFFIIIQIPRFIAKTPIHVVSGVHFKNIPTLLPYHSTTQLLYKFPYHTKSSFKLQNTSPQTPSCINSIQNQSTYCTNQFHLQELQNRINTIFNTNEINLDPKFKINAKNNMTRYKRALDFIGNALSWCCNTATMTNLQDLSKNEDAVDDKLNNLLDYVKEEHMDLTIAEDRMKNFTNNIDQVLRQLHDSIENYEINLQGDMNVTARTIDKKINQSNLQMLSYMYLALHYSTLKNVEEDCQHNYIPEDLLAMHVLEADLQKLDSKLSPNNLSIAIPLSKIFQLYSLPISKCYFEQENIILQIKIPLIPANTSYAAYSYLPIPLKWENHICNLVDHNFIILKSSSSTFIIDSDNNPDCDHQTSNLCLIPRYTSTSSAAFKCAKYLINGTNISELKHHCEFHCDPAPSHPIITQLKINRFLITNYNKPITITCNDSPSSKILPNISFGTIELELPCDCSVSDDYQTLISTIIPCDSRDFKSPSIFHLVPLPWTNLDHLKIDPMNNDKTEFRNITTYLLPKWNLSVPTFKTSKLEKVGLFDHIHLSNTWSDIIDDRRIMLYVLLAWSLILTLILIFSLYKIHILTIKLDLQQQRPPPPPPRIYSGRSTTSVQDSSL